jgi:hypothetical protein
MLDCSHHYCPTCGHHYGMNDSVEGCEDCNPPRQLSGEYGFRYRNRRHPSWPEPDYTRDREDPLDA